MRMIILIAVAVLTIISSSCGFQRSYEINYDKHGNITGGITITPMNHK